MLLFTYKSYADCLISRFVWFRDGILKTKPFSGLIAPPSPVITAQTKLFTLLN